MTVVAPLYTTCWGMLKQPDNQEPATFSGVHLQQVKRLRDLRESEFHLFARRELDGQCGRLRGPWPLLLDLERSAAWEK